MLKDFDKTKLKITQHDYIDRSIYHIDYAKTMNNVNPLYLIVPELYGSIEEQKGYKCEDEKDLPLNKLIKFNLVTISNRLIIERLLMEVMVN